ncbi:TIGR02391 family protein [Micromonospora sp. NBC_00362]|uniref:TIGR02391 family protein n=1 Tax=Micromonospora sp. NBC_00362 TaxID=2975975 RepID=UPI00338ED09C
MAQMELCTGAIGLFKNPSSHRRVDYSDLTKAAETILLADLLLRLLRKIPEGPVAGEGADLHGGLILPRQDHAREDYPLHISCGSPLLGPW